MNPELPGTGLLVLKLAGSLTLVVGLILVLQRAARRWGGALAATPGADQIRLLSQRPVGPRLSLAVVEVKGRTLLVGISPQGIRRVADLGRAASAEELQAARLVPPARAAAGRGMNPFSFAWAGGWFSRRAKSATPAAAGAGAAPLPGPEPSGRRHRAEPAPAGPLAFEQEMARRLSTVRARYRRVSEYDDDPEEAGQ